MKSIKVVAAIIKSRGENNEPVVLATQRGYGEYKDWWEFPGGKIESGEPPEEALVREIHEELAAEIRVERYLTTVEYDYPAFHLSMDCFWCSLVEGQLTLLEHEAAKWLPLNDLRQVNWLPADLLVIEAIEKDSRSVFNVAAVEEMENGNMNFRVYNFGLPETDADTLLLQMVDDHDMDVIEQEVSYIREMTAGQRFCLKAIKVNSWNHDLSPWPAEAVFGNEGFGEGAADTLEYLLKEVLQDPTSFRRIYLGGYSLSGLFALWAGYQTDMFDGLAAASPSVWFPHFTEYMKNNKILAHAVYLSLGDREGRSRNPAVSRCRAQTVSAGSAQTVSAGSPDTAHETIGDVIRCAYAIITDAGVDGILEWNKGNHFKEPDLRTAKAFAWLMNKENNTGEDRLK